MRVTARDVGGGFGQKMFVYREECAVVAGVVPPRAPGEVDRGPAREPALGRPLPQRVRARADGGRRRRHHPGHHRRPRVRRRRLRGVPGGAWTRCSLPGPYKIAAARVLDRDGAGPTPWARPRTAGRGCSRPPRARWRSTTSPPRSASTPPSSVAATSSPFGDLPFTAPSGNVFQEITPLETLEQALEILDYEAFRKEQADGARRGPPPRRGHLLLRGADVDGRQHPRHRGGHGEGRDQRPRRSRTSAPPSHGQSIETTMAQIVAEHLGVAYDDVTIVQADSQSTPYGPGTGGSRTAVVAGGAAREATVAVREKVLERRRAHDGGGARRPRDRRERRVGAGHAVEVGHA